MQKLAILFCILFVVTTHLFGQDGYVPDHPRLPYWQKEGRAGTVIIMLHGGPGASHDYLRPEWDTLSAFGTVVYYDQRNTARSERTDSCTWMNQVNDLKRVITHVAKGRQVVLAGSSWGSMLAVLYAYTYPDDIKAMILSGVVAWKGMGLSAANLPASAKLVTDSTILQYTCLDTDKTISSKRTASLEAIGQALAYLAPAKCYVASPEAYFKINHSLATAPTLAQLKNIKTKTLLVEGVGNCFADQPTKQRQLRDESRALYAHLSNAQLVTVTDGCHDPWFTKRGAFYTYCFQFLKEL